MSGKATPMPGFVIRTLAAIAVATFAFALPAIYRGRYQPPADATTASPGARTHVRPTAAQDAAYARETAAQKHPGVAVEGRDGYLFLGDVFQANIAQALGRRYYSPTEVADTEAVVADQHTWLAHRSIASAFVVVPANWDIYDDKLPAWSDSMHLQTPYQQLLASAPQLFVDIRASLKNARRTADTYSRLNSHWSDYGAAVGLGTILSDLRARDARFADITLPMVVGTRTMDEDNEFQPLTGAPGPNDWTVPVYRAPQPGYQIVDAAGRATPAGGDQKLDMMQFPVQTRSSASNKHRVLVFGDSTTTGVSALLAQSFSAALFVRHHYDEPDKVPSLAQLVADFHPDLVLTLMTERNLNTPIGDERAQWNAAKAYDLAGGEAALLAGEQSIDAAGIQVQSPQRKGVQQVLRITTRADAPTSLTITAGDQSAPTLIRVPAGTGIEFVALPNVAHVHLAATAGKAETTVVRVDARWSP